PGPPVYRSLVAAPRSAHPPANRAGGAARTGGGMTRQLTPASGSRERAATGWEPEERSGQPGMHGVFAWARRWRWTILASFAFVTVGIALLTSAIPTTYHSEVTFLVEPRTPQ